MAARPNKRLQYAGRLKAPREELLASLQGELSEEHLFLARLIRQHIATLETQLADLEHRLFDKLKPYEAAVQLLLTIPGIDRLAPPSSWWKSVSTWPLSLPP